MAKKHKTTNEFSPRAKRIYDSVRRGVANRTQGPSIMRGIDHEIEKIKVGSPDPELKVEIEDLKGKLEASEETLQKEVGLHKEEIENAKALVKEYDTAVGEAKYERDHWMQEYEKLQESYQKLALEYDKLKGEDLFIEGGEGPEDLTVEKPPTDSPDDLKQGSGSVPADAKDPKPYLPDEPTDPEDEAEEGPKKPKAK